MSIASTCASRSRSGLGHAVLCAEKLVGDNPFAVILADDLLHGKEPVMKQLVEVFNHYHSSRDRRGAHRPRGNQARTA